MGGVPRLVQRDRGRADHAHPWVQAPQLLHMWAPTGGQRLGAQLCAPIPTLGIGEGGGAPLLSAQTLMATAFLPAPGQSLQDPIDF